MFNAAVTGQRSKSCVSRETRSKTAKRSRAARSHDPHRTVPLCGSSSPDTTFISVLLPEPFSPTTAVTEPMGSVRDTSSRAGVSRSG